MGHDITAERNCVDVKKLEEYHDRFMECMRANDEASAMEWYEKKVELREAAYLRRSAGNPLARVIYIVLDAQNLDGGVSGTGESRKFTKREIVSAVIFLQRNQQDLANIQGQPAEFKQLKQMLESRFSVITEEKVKVIDRSFLDMEDEEAGHPLYPEMKFLMDCLEEIRQSGSDSIVIQFG